MTNTINNVPRELLERVASQPARGKADYELRALLSAPSPAGVDGLEVVGVLCISRFRNNPAMENVEFQLAADVAQGQHDLCRLSDAQAIIDGLRGEVAEERAKVAQLEEGIPRIMEASYQFRQQRDQLAGFLRDARELIAHGVFEDGYCCCGSSVDSHGLGDGHAPVDALSYHAGQVCESIDAALAELPK